MSKTTKEGEMMETIKVCPSCKGNQEVVMNNPHYGENSCLSIEPLNVMGMCTYCNGTGEVQ